MLPWLYKLEEHWEGLDLHQQLISPHVEPPPVSYYVQAVDIVVNLVVYFTIKALWPLVLGRSKVKCPPQARTSPKYNHGFQGPWPTNSENFIKICSQHFQLFCKQSDRRLSHTGTSCLGRGNYTTLNDNKPNAFVTTMPWWLEKLKEDQSQSGWVSVSWTSPWKQMTD